MPLGHSGSKSLLRTTAPLISPPRRRRKKVPRRAGGKPFVPLFVFQAEDGIRDGRVTGVQTCALPISGKTWTHLGLERTRNIGKLRVHPEDPDTVYVAALGHAHGTNPERGVFRSRDGGKTWKRVLYRNERAGAID